MPRLLLNVLLYPAILVTMACTPGVPAGTTGAIPPSPSTLPSACPTPAGIWDSSCCDSSGNLLHPAPGPSCPAATPGPAAGGGAPPGGKKPEPNPWDVAKDSFTNANALGSNATPFAVGGSPQADAATAGQTTTDFSKGGGKAQPNPQPGGVVGGRSVPNGGGSGGGGAGGFELSGLTTSPSSLDGGSPSPSPDASNDASSTYSSGNGAAASAGGDSASGKGIPGAEGVNVISFGVEGASGVDEDEFAGERDGAGEKDDPADYFSRLSRGDSLFKVVERRYRIVTRRWERHPRK